MKIKYDKNTGLVPAIIQDANTARVLMLGYMNEESYKQTVDSGRVTFYSRSKQRIWTKGETSGNFLDVVSIAVDCDKDTLLIQAIPAGPVCHQGTDTCWGVENPPSAHTLDQLSDTIIDRLSDQDSKSYTASLVSQGINKVAQKVGEEAVELIIEAKDDNKELFLGEAADLMYHFLVLLAAKEYRLSEVMQVLESRKK